MKILQRIAMLLAVLTVCSLAACGASGNTDETTGAEEAAVASSVSADGSATDAQPTQPETKTETTTKAEKTTKETILSEEEVAQKFGYGVWNDGSHLEYKFEIDGTGTCTDTTADTTETFRFEVNEAKGKVTFYMGEKEKKQKADFTKSDETHMTIAFSKNDTVALTYGALIRKDSLPFRMGTWKSTNDELYVFRADGSGKITPQDGAGTSFRYEVNPETRLLIMHIGDEDEVNPAVYSLSGDGLHMTIAYEYDYAELTWQSKETA